MLQQKQELSVFYCQKDDGFVCVSAVGGVLTSFSGFGFFRGGAASRIFEPHGPVTPPIDSRSYASRDGVRAGERVTRLGRVGDRTVSQRALVYPCSLKER